MNDETSEVDIIVVGAGAAGCVVVARLAELDPTLKILVLEAGGHTLNDPAIRTPGGFQKLSYPTSTRATHYESEPSEDMAGRRLIVDAGRCVGGGTSINYMMYTRGAASDYDDWEVKYGNPGWGFNSLLPFFKKFETYAMDRMSPWHGNSGPIHVTFRGPASPLSEEWLKAARAFDEHPYIPDPNDFHSTNGYGPWGKWIDGKGIRQDTGHVFLYPAVQRKGSNVDLSTDSRATRVIIESGRAVAVQFVVNGSTRTVKARKLVVLSCGTMGTPQVLERSGIGAPSVLKDAGVVCQVPLPGVGENYQDHNFLPLFYLRKRGDERNAYIRGDPQAIIKATEEYKQGKGILGTNTGDYGIKIRPTSEYLTSLDTTFEKEWRHFAPMLENAPDKPLFFHGVASGPDAQIPGIPEDAELMITSGYCGYPLSRGSVHIRSTDPTIPPRFVSGFFSHPADIGPLKWYYKLSREIVRRMPSYRGEFMHPSFAAESQAACSLDARPVSTNAPRISYSAEDDAILEAWIRQTAGTMWHSMGTCAMKARAEGGVVDPRLNVYGIQGLKIADLSTCPSNVSANTASTALAIGEKAASIIAEDLGLSSPRV
ncbi:alcohol oxidase [Exidia glandulosa HHB12029]|uniref:Alcohol oxidase n=1 Tax=Exidia glandulosa HHB12029 TaxID=1314781 RepID=A0A165DNB7_EXIGL|nr:alcohol oxidase [Exidia glandulosa HHB12029]